VRPASSSTWATKYATGRWWQPERCAPDAVEHDNTPTNLNGDQEVLAAVLGEGVRPLLGGDLPAYPEGPLCNPYGLSPLGRYAIGAMADRGLIIETDHLSVKARDEALDILENVSGSRVWDVNRDGAAHYGMFPDWIEDLRIIAGPQIVADMANGAEAYLQMWAKAERHAARR
jgi:hypothetical protein